MMEEGGDEGPVAARRGLMGLLGPLGWRTPCPLGEEGRTSMRTSRANADLRRLRVTTATRAASSMALIGSSRSKRCILWIITKSWLANMRRPPTMWGRTPATFPHSHREPRQGCACKIPYETKSSGWTSG